MRSSFLGGVVSSSGGGGLVRQPIDVNTIINWVFETATPWLNRGNGAACNATGVNSLQELGERGYNCRQSGAGQIVSPATAVGESNSCTLSFWIYFRGFGVWSPLVLKNYNTLTWVAPFMSFGWQLTNAGTGAWQASVTVGGVGRTIAPALTSDHFDQYRWTYCTLTYDAVTGIFIAYMNGNEIVRNAGAAGNIDWGNHGPWYALGNPVTSENAISRISDIRIENVARSAAFIKAAYLGAVGNYASL